jgi:hypothetical protein
VSAREDGVARLVARSLSEAWSFDRDLPWETRVDPEAPAAGLETLLAGFAPVKAMAARDRRRLAFAETSYHLSNLLAGERSGERLAAQVLLLAQRDVEFLAIVASEEAKHYLALERWLREKAGRVQKPDAALTHVIAALESEGSAEVKLLVGQVVLEWTAAALLATLVARVREPLLKAILRLNLRDESRHIAYGALLQPVLSRAFGGGKATAALEDLAYEAIRASARALLATPVWRAFGLGPGARRHAVDVLARLGVIERYQKHVPVQLARCGFPTDRIVRRLQRDLVPSLLVARG